MKTKFKARRTSRFKREYRNLLKRGYKAELFDEVFKLLVQGELLPAKYNDHALKGNCKGFRECHIAPDWLLVYRYEHDVLILVLQRTGTHSGAPMN